MIKIEKPSLLKDSPDYEDVSKNVAKLSKEEMESLGMVVGCGGCSKDSGHGCGKPGGSCCKTGGGCCKK